MKRRDFINATLAGSATLTLPNAVRAASGADPDVPAIRLSGAATVLEKAALAELAGRLRGTLILPAHPEYEQARRVWNPMVDKRPAVIARCANAADVATAITFARERELLLAVRSGGHSFPGLFHLRWRHDDRPVRAAGCEHRHRQAHGDGCRWRLGLRRGQQDAAACSCNDHGSDLRHRHRRAHPRRRIRLAIAKARARL